MGDITPFGPGAGSIETGYVIIGDVLSFTHQPCFEVPIAIPGWEIPIDMLQEEANHGRSREMGAEDLSGICQSSRPLTHPKFSPVVQYFL